MSRDPAWLRTYWRWFTVGIAAVLLLGFGIPETIAIINPGQGGTYTEVIQDGLGISQGAVTGGWVALTVLLVGFVAWFLPHLQGWWPWEKKPWVLEDEEAELVVAEKPTDLQETVELVRQVHPGLNRAERRAEARRLLRQARRQVRDEVAGGRGGEGS